MEKIFAHHLIIIIKPEVSTFPFVVIFFRDCVSRMFVASYYVVRCFSRQPWWCVHITPFKYHHSAELFEGTKHTNCLLVCVWGEVYRHNDITLRPRQNGRHFPDDIFKCIFLNENVLISIKISLKFVSKGQINNISALVWIMAWRRPGTKPLSEPKMGKLLTHICVTRPQWDIIFNVWGWHISICWWLWEYLAVAWLSSSICKYDLSVID